MTSKIQAFCNQNSSVGIPEDQKIKIDDDGFHSIVNEVGYTEGRRSIKLDPRSVKFSVLNYNFNARTLEEFQTELKQLGLNKNFSYTILQNISESFVKYIESIERLNKFLALNIQALQNIKNATKHTVNISREEIIALSNYLKLRAIYTDSQANLKRLIDRNIRKNYLTITKSINSNKR